MKEIWKDIKDYEGHYQVSNWGRVKSIKFGKEIILKHYKDGRGYLCVRLYKYNSSIQYKVHRLVAEAFLPNTDNLPQVNHKDEHKDNNIVSNLEWCSNEYNNRYGTRIERTSKPVLQYTLDGEFVKEWHSTMECYRKNGFNCSNISKCCRKLEHYKSAYGYIWRYKNEED